MCHGMKAEMDIIAVKIFNKMQAKQMEIMKQKQGQITGINRTISKR